MNTFFKIEGLVFLQYLYLVVFVVLPIIVILLYLIKIGRIKYKIWIVILIIFYLTISPFISTQNKTMQLVDALETGSGLQVFEGFLTYKGFVHVNTIELRDKYGMNHRVFKIGNELIKMYPFSSTINLACFDDTDMSELYGKYVRFHVKFLKMNSYKNIYYACIVRIDIKHKIKDTHRSGNNLLNNRHP